MEYWGRRIRFVRLMVRWNRHIHNGEWCRMTENACRIAGERWAM